MTDARWRVGGLLLLAAAAASVTRPGPAAVAAAGALGVALAALVPPRTILARVGLLLLSALPILLFLPFTTDLGTAATLVLRLAAVGLVALTLAHTTAPAELFAAAGAVGVPAGLVTVGLLAHRYSFLMFAEATRLRRAWWVRGFRPATSRHALRTVGYAVGALAVRADDRAERVAAALRCRGFDGVVRPLTPFRTRPADVLGFAGRLLAAAALVWFDRC